MPKLDKVVGVEETGVDGRGTVAAETVGVAVIELVVGEEFDDVAMTRKVVRSKRKKQEKRLGVSNQQE